MLPFVDTTPQAPLNVEHEQISSNLLLSWVAGYDGGRSQHFTIWYRRIQKKRQNWTQIRVLPNNASEFLLFDLKAQQTYEVTIVAENDLGLGAFSPILSIYMNVHQDSSLDYLYYSNETDFLRPPSPSDLQLSHSGSNLYITWNHPNPFQSSVDIVYYVIQWRSTIFFNNQQPQQSIVVQYPARSYVLKHVKQSKYAIQILAYSMQGKYSVPIDADIDIRTSSSSSSSCCWNRENDADDTPPLIRFPFRIQFHSGLEWIQSLLRISALLLNSIDHVCSMRLRFLRSSLSLPSAIVFH